MESDSVLAIIFVTILAAAGIAHSGMKRPLLAKLIFGIGALATAVVAYVLKNTAIPIWLLALSGLMILAEAWYASQKSKRQTDDGPPPRKHKRK